MRSRTEALVNLAVLALCLAAAMNVARWAASDPPPDFVTQSYGVGERIEIAEVEFGLSARTLLIVFNSNCSFCRDSMPFYDRLSLAAQRSGTRLLVLSTDSVGSTSAVFRTAGVRPDQVVQIRAGQFKIAGTPALLLVDRDGIVRNVWFGRLSELSEHSVAKAIS